MAMATRQAPTVTRPTTSCYMLSLLFLIITVATVSTPALAGQWPPPSNLVLYGFQSFVAPDVTIVEVAAPSGNLSAVEFGSTLVTNDILRAGSDPSSPQVGIIAGVAIFEKDLSGFTASTYVLNTTLLSGSISTQGVLDPIGQGEEAITGGTGDFRWAKGYVNVTVLSRSTTASVRSLGFTIKYDN